MPTTVIKSIGPGKDYATIQAWMDGANTTYPSGLVAADVIWKGELYPGTGGNEWVFTSSNTFPSITTDATRYFWLAAAPGNSFIDNAGKLTNALTYNTANGVGISFSGNYVTVLASAVVFMRISGIQFKRTAGGGSVANPFGAPGATFENCIFYNAPIVSKVSAVNCLFISTGGTLAVNLANAPQYFRNCTFVAVNTTSYAFTSGNYGSYLINNCALFGFANIASIPSKVIAASSTNNVTDLADLGWTSTGNLLSRTFSSQFENILVGTEDFRVKAGADLINAGIEDAVYTGNLDIVGSARSLTTPTVGAWEYAGSTPPPPVTTTNYTSAISRGMFTGIERGIV
jgi:hypothetical protein